MEKRCGGTTVSDPVCRRQVKKGGTYESLLLSATLALDRMQLKQSQKGTRKEAGESECKALFKTKSEPFERGRRSRVVSNFKFVSWFSVTAVVVFLFSFDVVCELSPGGLCMHIVTVMHTLTLDR